MPAAAVPALKVKVELPPAVTAVGLRLAAAPEGAPETDNETVCALPEVTAVETVPVAVAPVPTDSVDGETEREKSLVVDALTVTVTLALWLAAEPVPAIVRLYVPAATVPALKVRVELPPAVTAVGLRLAVAPEGTPETDKDTVCALPEVTAVETVPVAEAPVLTDSVDGETESEKSLAVAAITVTETLALWLFEEPAPAIVRL